jgi:CRP/FNR family transcriptional regulator, cyclic AMP receptor protein
VALRKDAKAEMIHAVPLFSGCGKSDLRAIASIADELSWPAGRVLARQGDRGREFFVIVEGSAEVAVDGRRIATLGAGDFFGEMALLTEERRSATVTAVTPLRGLVIVDRAFARLLREEPGVQAKILGTVAARLAANDAVSAQP